MGSSGRREGDRKDRGVGPRAAPVQKPALASTAATAGAGPGVGLLLPEGAVQAKLMKWLPGGAADGAPVGPSAKKRAVRATFQAQRATARARARAAPRYDLSERAPRLQARKEEREGKKLVERRARERAAAVAKRFQGTFTRTTWDPDFDGKHEDRPLWFRCKRNHEFLASVWQVVPRHPRARGVLVPALYRSGCNCCALFWRPSGRWSSTRSNSRTSRGALPAARPTASARGSRRARATAHGRTFSRARGTRTTSTPS